MRVEDRTRDGVARGNEWRQMDNYIILTLDFAYVDLYRSLFLSTVFRILQWIY